MAVIKPLYFSSAAITITLASLASSSTFTVGREGVAVVNTSTLYLGGKLSGKITVGTSPTANTQIIVYVFEPLIEATPTWPDVFGGTDVGRTLTSAGVGRGFLIPAKILDVDSTTSDRTYPFSGVDIPTLFGGRMPTHLGSFVTHNTGVNLNATGSNHELRIEGNQLQSV